MLQPAGLDFVIRSSRDRKINPPSGESLKSHILSQSCVDEYILEVSGSARRCKKRMTQIELRYGKVGLCRPANVIPAGKYPSEVEVYAVHVKEKADSVPSCENPAEWTLYTLYPIITLLEALQVVQYYRLRWVIEDLFRTVKSEGKDYESSELESGATLRKLFVMALMVVIQFLQLCQTRAGDMQQKPSPVFSDEQAACLNSLLPHFKGRTQKQNPFSRDNLA